MVTRCTFAQLEPGRWRCERCGQVVASTTGTIWATCAPSGSAATRIYFPRPMVGDALAAALRWCGITEARVLAWLGGQDCGCVGRRRWLNRAGVVLVDRLERWLNAAARFVFGE